jgi:hypothetical protein
VIFNVAHDIRNDALLISYEANGCPKFQKQLQNLGYQYFQYFAWADWIDFELYVKVTIEDYRYIDIPTITVNLKDVSWLKLMFERFKTETKINTQYDESLLWDKYPRDFNHRGINPLLLSGGTDITLYDISNIDPVSPLFEAFNKVIYAIRDRVSIGKIPESVGSNEISITLYEIKQKDVFLSFKLPAAYVEFCRGNSIDNESKIHLHVNDLLYSNSTGSTEGLNNFILNISRKGIYHETQ